MKESEEHILVRVFEGLGSRTRLMVMNSQLPLENLQLKTSSNVRGLIKQPPIAMWCFPRWPYLQRLPAHTGHPQGRERTWGGE